ncbi:MAG: ribosome biogenesis GTPase Der [Phycisphaeraceae bacterium]|nr:ribosome biogenesis GTPase Der [Phycisphaeraceae bacterium]
MPLPRVAIVGRPNVGKSSLLNMLAKDKVSIVDPTAGTTRDRVSTIVTLDSPDGEGPDRELDLTDTGGYGAYVAEGRRFNEVGADLASLTHDIEHQISEAVRSADLVLLVVDAQAGITPADETVARLLRERVLGAREPTAPARAKGAAKPKAKPGAKKAADRKAEASRKVRVVVVANKVDGPRWEGHAAEAASLGFGEALCVSARNNYRRRDLIDNLWTIAGELAAEQDEAPAAEDLSGAIRVAIVGKRNAGKSTLVNSLAGEKRVITSEIAGTTRDAVDVKFEIDGRTFIAIDTAGLRKKKAFADRIEHWAFDRMVRAIQRADVVLMLIDATEPVSQVDETLAKIVSQSYKPVVLVVNKWDMVEGRKSDKGKAVSPDAYEKYLHKAIPGLAYAPLSFVAASNGRNVRKTLDLAHELFEQSRERVTTGKLNRLVRGILETRGPASKLGTFAKVYYVAQVAVQPPTIGLVVNKPELFKQEYERFLINRFRDELPFGEVPIKLLIKGRKRRDGTIPFADIFEQEGEFDEAAGQPQRVPRVTRPKRARSIAEISKEWSESDAAAFFDEA